MRPQQWQNLKSAAKGLPVDRPPLSLIVDSPWLPGYLGINHMDYYLDPQIWLQANMRIMQEFPEVIFFPSWWVEYGMAIEPSALGCKTCFHPDQPPSVFSGLSHWDDLEKSPAVTPSSDGLMSFALHRYRMHKQQITDAGYIIPMVAARGPLCTAAFYRGLNAFMMDLYENPNQVHALLKRTTQLTIDWLEAQVDAIGESVEGVFVLDDIVGLLSRDHYLEFAHPYLRQVVNAFPSAWVKVYHNDANIAPFLEDLADVGFDVLNWGTQIEIEEMIHRSKGKVCLMGNLNPLEIAVRATPQEVYAATRNLIQRARGVRYIVSLGGGVSPGMPGENIRAMIHAWQEETK